MPKQRKAHMTLTKVLKIAAVFIATYLLIATAFWMVGRITYQRYIFSNLKDFAATEEKDLKDIVFSQAFEKARMCLSVPEKERAACQQEVRILIASNLYEEMLNDTNSLHFIKREGDTLYTLNWAGELQISKIGAGYSQLAGYYDYDGYDQKYAIQHIHLPPRDSSVATYTNLFSDRCKYFDLYDYYSCQVVTTIHLDNNTDGYLVSMMVLTEEERWYMYSMIIPLVFLMALTAPQNLFYAGTLILAGEAIIILGTPTFLAWLYWKKYLRES